jgi:hypothetical protein
MKSCPVCAEEIPDAKGPEVATHRALKVVSDYSAPVSMPYLTRGRSPSRGLHDSGASWMMRSRLLQPGPRRSRAMPIPTRTRSTFSDWTSHARAVGRLRVACRTGADPGYERTVVADDTGSEKPLRCLETTTG